jgi:hypothetical protein
MFSGWARGAKDAKVEATGLWGVEVSSLSFWKVCEGSEIGAIKPVHSECKPLLTPARGCINVCGDRGVRVARRRAKPGSKVIRLCSGLETAEC